MVLREALGLLGGTDLVYNAARRVIRRAALYGAATAFALTALVFFYIFLDRWLSRVLGDGASAAALLAGANLIAVASILIAIGLGADRRRRTRSVTARGLLEGAGLESGLALGATVGRRLRKSSPTVTLLAGLIGLAIGARPELLDLVRGRRRK